MIKFTSKHTMVNRDIFGLHIIWLLCELTLIVLGYIMQIKYDKNERKYAVKWFSLGFSSDFLQSIQKKRDKLTFFSRVKGMQWKYINIFIFSSNSFRCVTILFWVEHKYLLSVSFGLKYDMYIWFNLQILNQPQSLG